MNGSRKLKRVLIVLSAGFGLILAAGGFLSSGIAQQQQEASPVKPKKGQQAAEIPIKELVFCDIMPYFPS
jgi:hypothetical protein